MQDGLDSRITFRYLARALTVTSRSTDGLMLARHLSLLLTSQVSVCSTAIARPLKLFG